jgi:hypothetical protein
MQPAAADVVQNFTVPDSTAIAGALRAARMSFPWCDPPARGAPKSSVYDTEPTIGNTSFGTGFADEALAPAASASMSMRAGRIRIVSGPKFGTLAEIPAAVVTLESAR